jgi:hypothetical protein
MTYRKTKRDGNHFEVRDHLRRVGCDVEDLSVVGKYPDLLVTRKGEVCFIEVKIPGSAAKWTAKQLRWVADTKFNVLVAKDGFEASKKLRDRRYLTQKQKDMLAALLAINGKDFYTPKEIEPILAG